MDFANMTLNEAIEYCYKHQKQFVFDTDQRNFDCLISILESETITPSELPSYGMDYE